MLRLGLIDVWPLLLPYLTAGDKVVVSALASSFSFGVLCSPLWLTRPWQPHRRRRWGFGTVSAQRSATTPSPTVYHIFHHIWPFLGAAERFQSQRLSPLMLRYSFQRFHAATHIP